MKPKLGLNDVVDVKSYDIGFVMFIKTTWMLPAVVTYVSLFILIISIPTMLRRPKWESL